MTSMMPQLCLLVQRFLTIHKRMHGKLDGNSCISIITVGVARDVFDGRVDGKACWKIYDFHDVAIVFASPMVTSNSYCYIIFWEHMCTSRELLCSTWANLHEGGGGSATFPQFLVGPYVAAIL